MLTAADSVMRQFPLQTTYKTHEALRRAITRLHSCWSLKTTGQSPVELAMDVLGPQVRAAFTTVFGE